VSENNIDERAGAVVTDKAYDLPCNHRLLKSKGIKNLIIRCKGGNRENIYRRYVVEQVNAIVKRWLVLV